MSSYTDKLARGGNCVAFKKDKLPCALHGDRLVNGNWYCHIHDPEGAFQRQLRRAHEDHERTPEVEGQMRFSDLLNDENRGLALFTPSDDTQGRIASKRIKKWSGGKPA